MAARDLLRTDGKGLWCEQGGFHIDPWNPVEVAVVTHAHSDHARGGCGVYYCSREGEGVLRLRLPKDAVVRPVDFSAVFTLGATRVSLHPAGHIRGSAQVRVEAATIRRGGVWVASGDYKRQHDGTCTGFELVPCDAFITEATFGLPIYRWATTQEVARSIADWWWENLQRGYDSVLFLYALGKAQRVLHSLWMLRLEDRYSWILEERALLHGALLRLSAQYAAEGIELLPFEGIAESVQTRGAARELGARPRLALAPPSAAGSPWMRRFGRLGGVETGFASGWMRVRGLRRRRGYDRGFVLSDHVDWPDLLTTVRGTGAQRVLVTHGYSEIVARYFNEQGLEAHVLETRYEGDEGAARDEGSANAAEDIGEAGEAGDKDDGGDEDAGNNGADAKTRAESRSVDRGEA